MLQFEKSPERDVLVHAGTSIQIAFTREDAITYD